MPKPEGYKNDYQYIEEYLLPEWLKLFREKNMDYGDDSGKLGVKGGFVDIWRKVLKLKRSIWDGKPLRGEQPPEICLDLIGHVFLLLIDMQGEQQAKAAGLSPSALRELGVGE